LVTARWAPSKRVRKAQIVRHEMDPNGSLSGLSPILSPNLILGRPPTERKQLRPLNGRSRPRQRRHPLPGGANFERRDHVASK